jgi:hypothetical protein
VPSLKIHYLGPNGQVATINGSGINIKEHYGTRIITFNKKEVGGTPKDFYEHTLASMGFKRETLWLCTTPTCPRVQELNGCIYAQEIDPTGECLMYPKDKFPDIPHNLVVYRRV